jgi:DNA-binding transcriptional MerR regulator
MPTNWLDGNQALALAGVNRSTLRIWRERGLLPLTKPFEGVHYLYARTDLHRLLNAPRKGNLGIDLAAAQAMVAAAADAPSTPQAGGPSR